MSVEELNNTAISFFQRGLHNEAIKCLRAAIDRLVGDLKHRTSKSDPDHLKDETLRLVARRMKKRQDRQRTMEKDQCFFMCPIPAALTLGDGDESTSLYGFAVQFSSEIDPSDERSMDKKSAVLLYNLALVSHWQAVQLGISNALSKALRVYSMAMQIITKADVPDVETLSLAIWNNMGHIHTQFFQLNEASICFSRLRLLLQNSDDIRQRVSESDFDFFLLSAISRVWEIQLAPAA